MGIGGLIALFQIFGSKESGAKKDGAKEEKDGNQSHAERASASMGTCIYCGKPTGSSETRHPACTRQHALGMTKIRDAFLLKSIHAATEPAEFKTLLEGIAGAYFVGGTELRALAIEGIRSMIDTSFKDGELDGTESDLITRLAREFGLSANDLGPEGDKLAKVQILNALDEGRIHDGVIVQGAEILFQRGEKPIWLFNDVKYYTNRTRTEYVGGSHGMSIRILKGLYYRVGSYRGEAIKTEYLSHEGDGILVIASRNVYFRSGGKIIKIPIKKILSVQPFSDAIQITRDGTRAVPQTFTVDDPLFGADAIARLHQIQT